MYSELIALVPVTSSWVNTSNSLRTLRGRGPCLVGYWKSHHAAFVNACRSHAERRWHRLSLSLYSARETAIRKIWGGDGEFRARKLCAIFLCEDRMWGCVTLSCLNEQKETLIIVVIKRNIPRWSLEHSFLVREISYLSSIVNDVVNVITYSMCDVIGRTWSLLFEIRSVLKFCHT